MRTARCGLAIQFAFVAARLGSCGTPDSPNLSTGCTLAETGAAVANHAIRGGANATTIGQAFGDACAGLAGSAR